MEKFNRLDADILELILENDELNVTHENVVLDSLENWMKENSYVR